MKKLSLIFLFTLIIIVQGEYFKCSAISEYVRQDIGKCETLYEGRVYCRIKECEIPDEDSNVFYALYSDDKLIDVKYAQPDGEYYSTSFDVPDGVKTEIRRFIRNKYMTPLAPVEYFPRLYENSFNVFPAHNMYYTSDGGSIEIVNDAAQGNVLCLHDQNTDGANNIVLKFGEIPLPAVFCAKVCFLGDGDISYDWLRVGYDFGRDFKIMGAIGSLTDAWCYKNDVEETSLTLGGTLEKNRWYNIKMIIEKNHNVRYYIDNVFIYEDNAFYKNKDFVNAVNFYTSKPRTSTMLIDDVRVCAYNAYQSSNAKDEWSTDSQCSVDETENGLVFSGATEYSKAETVFERIKKPCDMSFYITPQEVTESVSFANLFYLAACGDGVVWQTSEQENSEKLDLGKEMYVNIKFTQTDATLFVNGRMLLSESTEKKGCVDRLTLDVRKNRFMLSDLMVKPSEDKELPDRLDYIKTELDRRRTDALDCIADLYDSETGGFFYSKDVKNSVDGFADIESTAQAVNYMSSSGVLDYITRDMHKTLVNYFDSRKTADGYYVEPQNEQTISDRQRARNYTFAKEALDVLNRIAPTTRTMLLSEVSNEENDKKFPIYLSSTEDYLNWIESLDWEKQPWTAGDLLSSSAVYIKMMDEETAMEYWKTGYSWIAENQNQQTGMWGGADFEQRVSGAYKINTYLKYVPTNISGGVFPNADKFYEQILNCEKSFVPKSIFFVRNLIEMIYSIGNPIEISENDKHNILDKAYDWLMLFSCEDGGFSLETSIYESDMNSIAAGFLPVHYRFYQILDIKKYGVGKTTAEAFLQKLTK